jgi:hypothetical protein
MESDEADSFAEFKTGVAAALELTAEQNWGVIPPNDLNPFPT